MAVKKTALEDRRSRYFQGIAAAFFRLRGAPFVLSSGDMVTIAGWEQAGIPLGVVEEGLRLAYEKARTARPAPRRLSSLSACDREVKRAFQEHRDRRVGRGRPPLARSRKSGQAREAVRAFLEADPPGAAFLRELFGRALGVLSGRPVREEDLEGLEAEVERLILEHAGEDEREAAGERVRAEFAGLPAGQRDGVLEVEIIRRARERYGVPHLSLFYY